MPSGLNFFTNEIDKTPASYNAWVDVDVSADGVPVGATGVILRLANTDSTYYPLAVRKNGSTDTRTPRAYNGRHNGAMVGIDGDRKFEAYCGTALCKIYLIGYTTDGTDFFTNSVDKTPGTAGSWQDIDASADIPSDAVGVLVQIWDSASGGDQQGGVRKNGSTDEITYGRVTYYTFAYQAVGVDASRYLEAKIYATSVKIYLIGYFKAPITFETNAVSYALSGTGAWTDITVSGAPTGADGALWLLKNVEYSNSGGTRKNGSTDESYAAFEQTACLGFFAGLDASKVAEGKISTTALDHYVIGYAKPAVAPPSAPPSLFVQIV